MIRLTGVPSPKYLDPNDLEVGKVYVVQIVEEPRDQQVYFQEKLEVGKLYKARLEREAGGFTCLELGTHNLCVHTGYTRWVEDPANIFYQFEVFSEEEEEEEED